MNPNEKQNLEPSHDQQSSSNTPVPPATPQPVPTVTEPQPATLPSQEARQAAERPAISQPADTVSMQARQPDTVTPLSASTSQPIQPEGAAITAKTGRSLPRKLLLAGIVVTFIAITIAGILLAVQVFSSSLSLTTYEGADFTIKYPETYQREEAGNTTIAFKEPGAESDETLSGIVASLEDISSLEKGARQMVEDQLIVQMEAFAQAAAAAEGIEVKTQSPEDTSLSGSPAKRLNAEVFKDGDYVGDFYIVAAVTETKRALVAVLAHESDPQLKDAALDILGSFTIKE